jgi:hypothetical protein
MSLEPKFSMNEQLLKMLTVGMVYLKNWLFTVEKY